MYTSSVSEKFRCSFRKPLSRVCLRRCLRILTNIHALQLPDRDPFVLFPGHALTSCARNAWCISFRRAPHIPDAIDRRISGPAKLTRLLATCAASENLDPRRGHVKQFVTRNEKNFARAMVAQLVRRSVRDGGRVTSPKSKSLNTARRSADRCCAYPRQADAAAPWRPVLVCRRRSPARPIE